MPATATKKITVTLTGATPVPVSVDFATANGTVFEHPCHPGIATASPDSLRKHRPPPFSALFPYTTLFRSVLVCGDTAFELDETFTVNLSNAPNATITKGTGTGTIQNDEIGRPHV